MSKRSQFRQFRDEFGLTQQELAGLLGVARNTITRYEIGLVKPPEIAVLALDGLRWRWAKQGERRGRRAR